MAGSTFSDNLTPILVLLPLAILLALRFPSPGAIISARRYYGLLLLASMLLGISIGLKLTNSMFALGFAAAWFWRPRFSLRFLLGGGVFALGIVAGFLIVNGWWAWQLWAEFKNPLFPFYNDIFKSDMIGHVFTNTPAWAAAKSPWEAFVYPFRWVIGIPPKTEWNFHDYRYAYITILLIALGLMLLIRNLPAGLRGKLPSRLLGASAPLPAYVADRWWFTAIWFLVAYAFWLHQFGALRYMIPLTLLTGALIVGLLDRLIPRRKYTLVIAAVLAVVALATLTRPPYARLSWQEPWYPMTIPDSLKTANTLYMVDSLSFVQPAFPDDAHFIGYPYIMDDSGLHRRAQQMIDAHTGPIRMLSINPWSEANRDNLAKFGLRRDTTDCVFFKVAYYTYQSCNVERISGPVVPKPLKLPAALDFRTLDNPALDYARGMYTPEPHGSWTNGADASIMLAGELPQDFTVKITAYAFGPNADAPVRFKIGSQERVLTFTNEFQTQILTFSFSDFESPGHILNIHVPHPVQPHDLDPHSGDLRPIGLHIQSILIEPFVP